MSDWPILSWIIADAGTEISSDRFIGQVVGSGIVVLALLAGIEKCRQIAKRETTHGLCVYSLMTLLIGWLYGAAITIAAKFGWISPIGDVVLRLLVPFIAVVVIVLGIVGLVDYARHQASYNQGRAQAIWAIILGFLLFLGNGAQLATRLASGVDAEKIAVDSPHITVGNFGETLQLADFNLEFKPPAHPWVKMNAKNFNPDACIAYISSNPDLCFLVIAERTGVETQSSLEGLMEYAQSAGRSSASSAVFSTARPLAFAGVEGLQYGCDAVIQGKKLHYSNWIGQRNGYVYQLTMFGDQMSASRVDAALIDLAQGFTQLDPNQVAHADGFESVGEHVSTEYGYRIRPLGDGWSRRNDDAHEASSDFEAHNPAHSLVLEVLPFRLPKAQHDTEALVKTLLARIVVEYPGPAILKSDPVGLPGLSGRDLAVRINQAGKTTHAYVRVIHNEDRAFLIVVSAGSDTDEREIDAKHVIEQVEVDPEWLPSAVALRPKLVVSNGLVMNDLGLAALEQENLDAGVSYFNAAIEQLPDSKPVLMNLVDATYRAKGPAAALERLDRFSKPFGKDRELMATRAVFLSATGDSLLARMEYAALFAAGHSDEDDLLSYVNLLVAEGDYDEAIKVTDQFLATRPSIAVRRWRATLLSQKGDHEAAISALRELTAQSPTDVQTSLALGRALEDSGDYSAALEIGRKLTNGGRRDEESWMLVGRSQLQLKWYAEAKATLEKAVQMFPGNQEARDLLAFTSSMLGQGDNSSIKTPLPPIEIPAEVQAAITLRDRDVNADASEFGAIQLLQLTGYDYRANQPLRTTSWQKMKVLDTGGVTRFSSFRIDFDPVIEQIYVNRVAVFDPSGKLVAEGSIDDYYVLDENDSAVASHDQVLNVPVPGLKPGYVVELIVTRKEFAPAEEFAFQELLVSGWVPILKSGIFVTGDTSSIVCKTNSGGEFIRSEDLAYLVVDSPEPYRLESLQPDVEAFLAMAWLGDAQSNWNDAAREYIDKIKNRLDAEQEIEQTAAELTADCTTALERLAKLAAYVQDMCTYQAIEFGSRGQIPNLAAQTQRLKYGDCKDHALLLYKLLLAEEIPAQLALVNASGMLQPEMASVDQFDHMIVYVPPLEAPEAGRSQDGGWFVDTTAKSAAMLLNPPYGLAGKEALILDAEQPRLLRIPKYPHDAGLIQCERKIAIEPADGESSTIRTRVRERVQLNAFVAPAYRSYLKQYEPADRGRAIQDLFITEENARVDRAEVEHLDACEEPLVLNAEYELLDAFHRIAGAPGKTSLIGQFPTKWESRNIEVEYARKRHSPFAIELPLRIESTTEIQLPSGYRMIDTNEWAGNTKGEFVHWAARARDEGSAIILEYRARQPAGQHLATSYEAYHGAMKDAVRLFRRPIRLEVDGP